MTKTGFHFHIEIGSSIDMNTSISLLICPEIKCFSISVNSEVYFGSRNDTGLGKNSLFVSTLISGTHSSRFQLFQEPVILMLNHF